MLPIIIGGIGIGLLAAAKGRPSTLFRLVEDGVVGAGRGIARRTTRLTHDVKIEMAARQLASAQRRVAEEDARLAKMSRAQKVQHARDVESIVRRASELRTKRK